MKNPEQVVHLKLVRRIKVGVKNGVGGEARYWPHCGKKFPSRTIAEEDWLPFEDWWGEAVFRSDTDELTRKDLVLFVANKNGGTQVDKEVEER